MTTANDVTAKIEGLIAKGNSTTGFSDADLTTVVDRLTRGYGKRVFTVSSALVHVSSANAAGELYEGEPYSSELTADEDYSIQSVSVLMGGEDVTASAYIGGRIEIAAVTGDVVVTATATENPSYFNVTWADHFITCGQNTDNYNAWAPHGLQYDDVNDAYLMLQCHSSRHVNGTLSAWTLSRIYPDEPWRADDMGLPAENRLGALWVEGGVWYVLGVNSTTAYRSEDMGKTWNTFQIDLSASLWGIYKCGGVYYSGDDATTDTYYTSTDLRTWTKRSFGFSEQYPKLTEASFCQLKGHIYAFLRTNDSELGHPVILKSTDGVSWEFVSDALLHAWRSTTGCAQMGDYIVIADIDRDNGLLYYSRFDGETVEELNEWNVGRGGDDFHCPCVCSNGRGTVILEFMLHSWMFTGSFWDADQYACENMMFIGSAVGASAYSFKIERIVPHYETGTDEEAEAWVRQYYDIYAEDGVDVNIRHPYWNADFVRIEVPDSGQYQAAVVCKLNNVASFTANDARAWFYRGAHIVFFASKEGGSQRYGASINRDYPDQSSALLHIRGRPFICNNVAGSSGSIPSVQLREHVVEVPESDYTGTPQINAGFAPTDSLGLRRQAPIVSDTGNVANLRGFDLCTYVDSSGEVIST